MLCDYSQIMLPGRRQSQQSSLQSSVPSTWQCGYVSHVNGLSIDNNNNNNNNETSAMPAAATLYVCALLCYVCVFVVVPFLFVSCIIVIKILQFLAQFRALSPPLPPPSRCHLTLTTVQLPYQRQPPYPTPAQSAHPQVLRYQQRAQYTVKPKNVKENESEHSKSERTKRRGVGGHKEIKRSLKPELARPWAAREASERSVARVAHGELS